MLTLGIDLSSGRRDTAACEVVWDAGRATVTSLATRQRNADLLPRMRVADVVGLDAPLGWPESFVDAVSAWSDTGIWPVPWVDGEGAPALRLRRTDRWVDETIRKQPLSVSSDRIGVTAWRAAALLTELGGPVDRVRGRVREVYPGAALIAWRLLERRPVASYKRDAGVRAAILDRMTPAGGWLDAGPYRDDLVASDHAFDALVSALVARAAASAGTAHPPPPGLPADVIEREGWIWLPTEGSWDRLACGHPAQRPGTPKAPPAKGRRGSR